MSLRRLILPLALLLTASFAAPAQAEGWLRFRSNRKQQMQARQAKQKKDADDLHNRVNSKSREEAERWAKQQRIKAPAMRTHSSQVPSSNYRAIGKAKRVIVTIAEKFARAREGVSSMRQMIIRNQRGSAPIFGWKMQVAHNATTPHTGGPSVFAFNY